MYFNLNNKVTYITFSDSHYLKFDKTYVAAPRLLLIEIRRDKMKICAQIFISFLLIEKTTRRKAANL